MRDGSVPGAAPHLAFRLPCNVEPPSKIVLLESLGAYNTYIYIMYTYKDVCISRYVYIYMHTYVCVYAFICIRMHYQAEGNSGQLDHELPTFHTPGSREVTCPSRSRLLEELCRMYSFSVLGVGHPSDQKLRSAPPPRPPPAPPHAPCHWCIAVSGRANKPGVWMRLPPGMWL